MPVSCHEPYEAYKKWVVRHQPRDCWDIGMGYGNIGMMAQHIIPELELNGVEVFVPYLIDIQSHAKRYKRILVSDIRDCFDKLWQVDMVVAFDVIEHLPKADGVVVIDYLKSIAKMGLLVALPIVNYPQGPMYGNEAERHLAQWTVEEMEELGGKTLFKGKVCGLFEFK